MFIRLLTCAVRSNSSQRSVLKHHPSRCELTWQKSCGEQVTTVSTSKKFAGRCRLKGRWKLRLPVVTTSCSSVHRDQGRRCSRNVCRRSCHHSNSRRRSS